MGSSYQLNGPIYALATDFGPFTKDGYNGPNVEKVYIGGTFTDLGGQPTRKYFTRLAATLGNPDSNIEYRNVNYTVYSIRVQSNYGVIVGGAFTYAEASPRGGVARFFPATDADHSIADTMYLTTWSDCFGESGATGGPVHAVTLGPAGQIYVGGSFTAFEGSSRSNVARLFPNP